jgi:hypothetical protein
VADRRKAKELRRRKRHAKRQAQARDRAAREEDRELTEFVEREFGDESVIRDRVARFTEMALEEPLLGSTLLLPSEIVIALEDLPPTGKDDDDADGAEFHERAAAALSTREWATRVRDATARALGMRDADDEEGDDDLTLMTASVLLEHALANARPDERVESPILNGLFLASLERAFTSGGLLAGIVLPTLKHDRARVREHFARALGEHAFVADLASIELPEREADVLASLYDPTPEPPLPLAPIHIDGVLHAIGENQRLFEERVDELAGHGLTPDLRAVLVAGFERAFEADMTPELVHEIRARTIARAHEHAQDGDAADARRGLVAAAALRAVPITENVQLRALYLHSFTAARFCFGEQWPFVERLCQEPRDLHALEEYERYLVGQGEETRARRVIRYARSVRLSRSETLASGLPSPTQP